MIVYVEYVILNNLLANYAVVLLTEKFGGVKPNKWRKYLCLGVATVFGTFSPLLALPDAVCSALKALCSLLLVFILTGWVKLKRYLITVVIFYGASFGVAGAVTALLSFTSFRIEDFTDTELTFCVLLGSFTFRYIAKQVATYIKNRTDKSDGWVKIQGVDKEVLARAFLDTGNKVSYKGVGVTFISKDIKNRLNCVSLNDIITVKTVTGEEYFEVFIVRKMMIGTKVKENFPAVFWDKKEGEYDIILHGGDDERTNTGN